MLLQNYPSPLHRTIKSILIITFPKRLQAKHQSTHYPTPKATRNIRECGKLNKLGFILTCVHRKKKRKDTSKLGSECARTLACYCWINVVIKARLRVTHKRDNI